MRRLFWLGMGVTVGALLVRKLSRVADRIKPAGIAATVAASVEELAESVTDFAADVRVAMQEHEVTLRAGAGLDGDLAQRDTP